MKLRLSIIFLLDYYTSSKFQPVLVEEKGDIRAKVTLLYESGRFKDLYEYLDVVDGLYGTLAIDSKIPSLYSYRGVALSSHTYRNQRDAIVAFENATKHTPADSRAFINLGEVCMQLFRLNDAVDAFSSALTLGNTEAQTRLLKVLGWLAKWSHFEYLSSRIEKEARRCYILQDFNLSECRLDSGAALEYTDAPGKVHRLFHALSPNSRMSTSVLPPSLIAPLWDNKHDGYRNMEAYSLRSGASISDARSDEKKRLKVGIISSDYGVHPVATLIRGPIQFIDRGKIELFCFAVDAKVSFWGLNISRTAEHFISLAGMNAFDAALKIAACGIEILIDLNGHTQNSGLVIMSHMPAPLQVSFLGLPHTTGAAFIQHYIGDSVAIPVENALHFSEHLLLLPSCYIANDYAQMQGDVLYMSGKYRANRSALNTDVDTSKAPILFSTMSNSQKIDPIIFHTWMNILQAVPQSQMVFVDFEGMQHAIPNLRASAAVFGVPESRIAHSEMLFWVNHVQAKTAIDINLDTVSKNGHTTGLDAVWAGVPTISLGGGAMMPTRAAESIALTLGSPFGLAFSLKEYEDIAVDYARGKNGDSGGDNPNGYNSPKDAAGEAGSSGDYGDNDGDRLLRSQRKLRILRDFVGQKRITSDLFSTPIWTRDFTQLMQTLWEVEKIAAILTREAANVSKGIDRHVMNTSMNTISRDGRPRITFHVYARHRRGEKVSSPAPRRVRVSQAIESEELRPKWLPGEGAREAFRRRFGYDPSAPLETRGKEIRVESVARSTRSDYMRVDKEAGSVAAGTKTDENNAFVHSPSPLFSCEDRFFAPPLTEQQIHAMFHSQTPLFLNIGGINSVDGWWAVNSQTDSFGIASHSSSIFSDKSSSRDSGSHTQEKSEVVLRLMHDLVGFPNNSVSAVYASHVLEHNSFGDGLLEATLTEWHRVIHPTGLLLISVPDLAILSRLYLDQSLTLQDRWMLTMMIYGAQHDSFDHHKVGFDFEILSYFLTHAGFCEIERVGSFRIMKDTSDTMMKGRRISLNVAARKCSDASPSSMTAPAANDDEDSGGRGCSGGGDIERNVVSECEKAASGGKAEAVSWPRIDHHADPYITPTFT